MKKHTVSSKLPPRRSPSKKEVRDPDLRQIIEGFRKAVRVEALEKLSESQISELLQAFED